jgi:inner membrane transporter RhtA
VSGAAAPAEGAPRGGPPPAHGVDLRGVALVVLAVTTLQLGAAFAVTLFDELGPAGTSALRLGLAAAVLWALWRPRVRGHPPGDLLVTVAFGVTLGTMNWAIYEAMDRIPIGVAVTIEFAGPLGLAVALSHRALDLVWVVLAAAGILLLTNPFGASGVDSAGVAFALLAAAAWAAYIPISARTGRLFPGGGGLALAMAVGALLVAPAGIAQAGADLLEPELLASGAVVALASSVVPYSLELESLRRIPARVFGILMSLEPGVAALAGFLVLDQGLSATDLLAIGLVVVASAGATYARSSIASSSSSDEPAA